MITAWDDRPSTADTDQHNDAGICSSCGHWYPQSEYTEDPRTCRECLQEERDLEEDDSRAYEDHLQDLADTAADGDDY